MKKSFFGSVEGDKARKYPAYKYREAEAVQGPYGRHPLFTIWGEQLVYPGREYPRRNTTISASVPVLHYQERADFVVEIGEEVGAEFSDGSLVEVYLLPGTYTAATKRKLIFQFRARTEKTPKIDQLLNWAVTTAFL